MPGRFYQLKSWTWDGTVKNFEYDGSWEFQDYPKGTDGSQYLFWTALGPNTAGKKTEHNAPALNSNLPSAFIQTSTAGYFGEYSINGAAGIAGILSGLASGVDFPDYMDANYYLYQGETDVSGMIHLGGKGIRSDYKDQVRIFERLCHEAATYKSNSSKLLTSLLMHLTSLVTESNDGLLQDSRHLRGHRWI